MTTVISGVNPVVGADGYTVTTTTSGIGGYAQRGVVVAWGDGHVSVEYDNTATHVYARPGTYGIVASCGGRQARNTVTTTAAAPAPASNWNNPP